MRYAVLFDTEEELDLKEELKITEITIDGGRKVWTNSCPIVLVPARRPCSNYRYNTYQEGYDKGVNDTLDKLEGKNGEYDPLQDKV